jgi:hypothetical protein
LLHNELFINTPISGTELDGDDLGAVPKFFPALNAVHNHETKIEDINETDFTILLCTAPDVCIIEEV